MVSPDLRVTVFAVLLVETLIAVPLVAGRLYSRKLMKWFGWDDAMVVLGFLTTTAYNAGMMHAVTQGYGRRVANPLAPPPEYVGIVKTERISQLLAVISFIPTKLAVGLTEIRIFPGKKLHLFIYIIVWLHCILFFIDAFLWLFECWPISDSWARTPTSKCMNPQIYVNYTYAASAWNTIVDFALAIIPWFYIPKLQMKKRERIAIACAMSLGVFAGAASIIRAVELRSITAFSDYAYDTIPLVLWASTELLCVQIAACLPIMRPLLQKLTGKWRMTTKGSGGTPGSYPLQISNPQKISDHHRLGSRTDSEEILVESGLARPNRPIQHAGVTKSVSVSVQAHQQHQEPQGMQGYNDQYGYDGQYNPRPQFEKKQYGMMG